MNDQKTEKRIYELAFLILPNIEEEKVSGVAEEIKNIVKENAEDPFDSENPKLKEIAYEMEKQIEGKKRGFNRAYFGWMKFESSPEAIDDIKFKLDTNKNLLRFMIIKTERERSASSKDVIQDDNQEEMKSEDRKQSVSDKNKEEKDEEVDEKELDKKIEEMV